MTNVYQKSLTKQSIYNLTQNAAPVGDVLDTPLNVVGLHHKNIVTAEGEEKLLTMIFVDEEGETKSYFSSARSFFNAFEDLVGIFKTDIEKEGIIVEVKKVTTRNNNTVYTVSL